MGANGYAKLILCTNEMIIVAFESYYNWTEISRLVSLKFKKVTEFDGILKNYFKNIIKERHFEHGNNRQRFRRKNN